MNLDEENLVAGLKINWSVIWLLPKDVKIDVWWGVSCAFSVLRRMVM